ncbi:MAG: FAD-dependent monooxygenase, partial [Acidimicrobiales bacterium]
SWKLAAVADGLADDGLLDTYDQERRPHAAGQVVHSVDAGMLIDAIANDGEAALGSGYGQRPFPKLKGSMFHGTHDRLGAVLPNPMDGSVLQGQGWRILHHTKCSEVPAFWHQLNATVTDVALEAFPGLVTEQASVIVRPDRYIVAVTEDLGGTTRQLAEALK